MQCLNLVIRIQYPNLYALSVLYVFRSIHKAAHRFLIIYISATESFLQRKLNIQTQYSGNKHAHKFA